MIKPLTGHLAMLWGLHHLLRLLHKWAYVPHGGLLSEHGRVRWGALVIGYLRGSNGELCGVAQRGGNRRGDAVWKAMWRKHRTGRCGSTDMRLLLLDEVQLSRIIVHSGLQTLRASRSQTLITLRLCVALQER
jgi:hypothetical protein